MEDKPPQSPQSPGSPLPPDRPDFDNSQPTPSPLDDRVPGEEKSESTAGETPQPEPPSTGAAPQAEPEYPPASGQFTGTPPQPSQPPRGNTAAGPGGPPRPMPPRSDQRPGEPPAWTRPLHTPPPGARPVRRPRKKRSAKWTVFVILMILFFTIGAGCLFVGTIILSARGQAPSSFFTNNNVAVVEIWGPIYDSSVWIKQMESYAERAGVPAIVLHFNSPGGGIVASQELWQEVKKIREEHKKVVVAFFDDVAASGAYYAAASADHIVCTPGSMTGSIGVYMQYLEMSGLFEKVGMSFETVKAGKFKAFGTPDRHLEDYERDMLQSVIDDYYSQFLEAVYVGRRDALTRLLETDNDEIHKEAFNEQGEIIYPFTEKIVEIINNYKEDQKEAEDVSSATETVSDATSTILLEDLSKQEKEENLQHLLPLAKELAEGKVYTGRQALKVGLVDSIGFLDDAIDVAAELADIEGEPNVLKRDRESPSLLDLISEGLSHLSPDARQKAPLQYRMPLEH